MTAATAAATAAAVMAAAAAMAAADRPEISLVEDRQPPANLADLPRSCVGWLDPICGLAAGGVAFAVLQSCFALSNTMNAFLTVCATIVSLAILEIRRIPPGMRNVRPTARSTLVQATVRFAGFVSAIVCLSFLYWLFPEYQLPSYAAFFELLGRGFFLLLILSFGYFVLSCFLLHPQNDGIWNAGLAILGQWQSLDRDRLCGFILSMLVLGFFLPLSFGELVGNLEAAQGHAEKLNAGDQAALFDLLFKSILACELVFVVAGYASPCRLFNSHIRSTDRTMLGWVSTLICYDPFFLLIFSSYLDYRAVGRSWATWSAGNPYLATILAVLILGLMVLHFWCDACFGLHFSNLTNRGIITNGPFRWCKHPAYLIKNVRWWLQFVPFAVGGTWVECFRLSALLLAVNLLYAIRAYTEERHLSLDPAYVKYGLWIEENGLLRVVGRLCPALSFRNRLSSWKLGHHG